MAKIVLDRPGVPPIVGQLVAARVSPYHAGHYRSERNRLRAAAGSSAVSGRAGALYRAVLSHIGAGLTWGGDFPLTLQTSYALWSNRLG